MNTSYRLMFTASLLMRAELVSLSLILSLRVRACVCVCARARARELDRQCKYDVTLRRVRATIDAVKNNKYEYYIL